MSFTLTFAWWWIPAAITAAVFIYAFFASTGGMLDGVFETLVGLAFAGLAWAVAGFFK